MANYRSYHLVIRVKFRALDDPDARRIARGSSTLAAIQSIISAWNMLGILVIDANWTLQRHRDGASPEGVDRANIGH